MQLYIQGNLFMKDNLVYNKVKKILEFHPETRDSDKKLLWLFWTQTGKASVGGYETRVEHDGSENKVYADGYMNQSDFMTAVIPETITRCRRKLQREFINLQPRSEKVRKERRFKALQKGTHIYRETY